MKEKQAKKKKKKKRSQVKRKLQLYMKTYVERMRIYIDELHCLLEVR